MGEILNVTDIEKYYGTKGNITKAIDQVSFSLEEGEFVGIMGASGSGKTTLLNCISTIDTVSSGYITVRGQEITKMKSRALSKFRREELGFIFQDYNLLDTMTFRENIELPLVLSRERPEDIRRKVDEVTKRLEITALLDKYPYEVSGGQRQRASAARAIISDPQLVLADEPTGALDSKSSAELLRCLTDLNEKNTATILLVTHDAFTASYCKRILFIKDGEIFTEIDRGGSRKEFFDQILKVLAILGGDNHELL